MLLLAVTAVAVRFRTIPRRNTEQSHFDTLIVLGTPSLPDGSPSPEQRERVLEAVREYRAGVAPHLIMTGGAAHNGVIEAHTMAVLALNQGVRPADVVEERFATNTVQNIYLSQRIMRAFGWTSAEIVSSPSHLPRTSLILSHYSFPWSTHAAHWPPEYTTEKILVLEAAEAAYCTRLNLLGFPPTPYLPPATAH